MKKNIFSLVIVIILIIITLIVFQDPEEQTTAPQEDRELIEELIAENEQLKQQLLDAKHRAELYESRYNDQEYQQEHITETKEFLESQLERILKDIYKSDLSPSDLPNLDHYHILYLTRYTEYHDSLDGFDVQFRIFPDPELTTGEEFGYAITFAEDYEVYEGKEIGIIAKHTETEETVTILEPQERSESEVNRLTAFANIPTSGFWRFEATLDGNPYGEVEIYVLDP